MKLKTLYGLPRKVIFCKKSLISNQRPSSEIEFLHTKKQRRKQFLSTNKGSPTLGSIQD